MIFLTIATKIIMIAGQRDRFALASFHYRPIRNSLNFATISDQFQILAFFKQQISARIQELTK
jgi:hypothetical protein